MNAKPRVKRYYAAADNGWSFVVHGDGEWVWGWFHHARDFRPTVIARDLNAIINRFYYRRRL